jgi:hydroxyacylglutathione hydrolase
MMPAGQNQAVSRLEIHQFPCLQDNYGYLIRDAGTWLVATIDTPDAHAIERALADRHWKLNFILNTHHHADHAGGNLELKKKTGCTIVGPRADAARIPGIDVQVGDGEVFEFGSRRARVHDTPGHTRGHIVYHFEEDRAAFVGDTLFAMGCGRLFEGTPAQMWESIQKLMRLPDDTRVYCAHEYTQKNARFALTVEPGNPALVARAAEVDRLRAQGLPTVPSTIGREKQTNPFMRPDSPRLQATLGMAGAGLVEVFAETRRRRNGF